MSITAAPVSIIILVATVALSLYTLYRNPELFAKLMLNPQSVVYERKWYLMVSSGFIHANLAHLAFNMLTFYFFALELESVMGSLNFSILYFGSLILSDVTTVIKHKDNPDYRALGASGAISGALFSYVLFYPKNSIYIFFIPIGIPAPIFAILFLAYCYWAARKAQGFINHEAHFWGALAGIVITILLIPEIVPDFIKEVF